MKQVGRVAFVVALACQLVACQMSAEDKAPHKMSCGGVMQNACRATFRALAEDPHGFDGRRIRVEGYLGASRALFVLSSSKELFEAGLTDESSIRIRGPMDVQERIFQEHAYSWVSVTGTFKDREKTGTTDDLLLGEIFAPLDVQSLRWPVEVERATFGEVLLNLEDIN
ncbi:hypothetical protein I5U67_12395 [Stenotrophomonas maltophilia]|uniref:Uncharacterized protein n=1 Tax=Stenotrophomonas maltophilia TaxID=40324 RepID=A0A6B8J5L1_STEMA|nr:hypothetical protein [Stenotrophomonas maltophilia]MBH1652967.1 hypothetical protein [Stenotrophomonas maltophilia]QGM00224.1 hypothetical protein FEO89_05520 [Stenotrophomonas maltophilia]HDS1511132.1 hypothetical protein [Stenotrophomonas maltophilia]